MTLMSASEFRKKLAEGVRNFPRTEIGGIWAAKDFEGITGSIIVGQITIVSGHVRVGDCAIEVDWLRTKQPE